MEDPWPDQRNRVLPHLPAVALDLLHRIEMFAGRQVTFRDPTPLNAYGISNGPFASAYCDEERAHVALPDGGAVDPAAITHELLHIHRYWVEGVPQLDSVSELGDRVDTLSWLDNVLEHLIIVPQQIVMGVPPGDHWREEGARIMNMVATGATKTEAGRHRMLLAMWTVTAYVEDAEFRRQSLAMLQQYQLQRQARMFLGRLQKAHRSKERMATIALQAMGLAGADVRLCYIRIREGRKVLQSLPA